MGLSVRAKRTVGLSVESSVLSFPVAFFMLIIVARESASETRLSALHGSVNKTEFCDVVFVYHGKNRSAWDKVHFGVLHVGSVFALQFSIAVIRNDALSLLLRTAVIRF